MREVVIVSANRTAIARSPKGSLRQTRPDDFASHVISGALRRANNFDPARVEDVIFGCAQPELEQGLNVARVAALRAGLPASVPGLTVNRFCASGLEAIAIAAQRIACGSADIIIAGGVESMTMVSFMGETTRPNPSLMTTRPDTYLGMGLCVEQLAKQYGVTREQSDAFAVTSHDKALDAIASGRFVDEIEPISVTLETMDADGKLEITTKMFDQDEGPRPGTSTETLANLKNAFMPDGVITAGNASQRSDGASALLLMTSEMAAQHNLTPLLRFVGYAVAADVPENFGIGPAITIPKVLKQTGISLDQIDLIEFNEAFAAQVLCSDLKFPLPMDRMNVNGGAIALGHPLGCTGARQTTTLAYEMDRRKSKYGLVTMCAALGMGAAAIFQRP
ncbi:MAG: thiolase family protein [Chthonomonadales bacterium]